MFEDKLIDEAEVIEIRKEVTEEFEDELIEEAEVIEIRKEGILGRCSRTNLLTKQKL